MAEPAVAFILSVVCDERMQALRGEAAVVVNGVATWTEKFNEADMEGHVAGAITFLGQAAREALEVAAASKVPEDGPDAAAPPKGKTQRAPRRRKDQAEPQVKAERISGVSRSRLR